MNSRNGQILRALVQADFVVMLQNRRSLILGIVLPLIVLFTSKQGAGSLGGAEFLIALCITLGLVSMAILGYSISTARDRDKGIFQRLRVTPAPTWAIMMSRLGVQVVANMVMAVIVLAAGVIYYKVSLGAEEYALLLLATVVGAAVFLSIGQALVGLVKSADAVSAAGRVVYILVFLLGLVGRSGALGKLVENVSTWSPMGVVATVFYGAMQPAMWNGDTWLSLALCIGYIVAFVGVGIKWFQWSSS